MVKKENIEKPNEIDELRYQQIIESAYRIVHKSFLGPINFIAQEDGAMDSDFQSIGEAMQKANTLKTALRTNNTAQQTYTMILNHLLNKNVTFKHDVEAK